MILTEEEKKRIIKKCAGKSLADLYPILEDEWGDNGDLTPFKDTLLTGTLHGARLLLLRKMCL